MYRLLIVDDEQMIVDWLYRLFSGLTHLELDIYKAVSGQEAVDLLNRMKMDIVLTDIRMPEMNGLQLLEYIKGSWPQCRVIFLTGYDEFDYVYTAIKHDGVSYLLKTEDDSEIVKAVVKAIEDIDSSLKNTEFINKAIERISAAVPLMQREYLFAMLSGDESVFPVTQQQLDELEIPLKSDKPLILLLGRVDNISKKLSHMEKSKLIYTIKETTEKYLLGKLSAAYILYEDSYQIWLIQPPEPDHSLPADGGWKKALLFIRETLEIVQRACIEALNSEVSFALANEPVSWHEIPEKAFALKRLLNGELGFGRGIILTDSISLYCAKYAEAGVKQDMGLVQSQIGKIGILQNHLDRGREKDFFDLFEAVTGKLREVKSMHSTAAMEIYFSLALMYLSYINRNNIVEKLAFRIGINKLTRIDEFDSWNDAVEYLHELAKTIFELQDSEQEKRAGDTVTLIQQYILEHLAEDISLARLSELAFFNPSYLSRLFKQATGMNITEYVHSVRIDKAKQLLAKNELRIHEIAAALGYESPAYFSKFFRKATNLTPQEYRDTLIKM